MPDYIDEIDQALDSWRQGDLTFDVDTPAFHLADITLPLTAASESAASEGGEGVGIIYVEKVVGFAMLSQTCDVVRGCRDRPFITVACVVEVDEQKAKEVEQNLRPRFAFLPALAGKNLVVDLDLTMTLEKSIVSKWQRVAGWSSDEQIRNFAKSLARHRNRVAFPDDYVDASRKMQSRLVEKHDKQTPEGEHLSCLREVRVKAAPSWDAEQVNLTFWFIKKEDPSKNPIDWKLHIDKWIALLDQTKKFKVEAASIATLKDLSAEDYVESDPLDVDHLSA